MTRPAKNFKAPHRNKRQKLWAALREGGVYSAAQAATEFSLSVEATRAFFRILYAHKYLEKNEIYFKLIVDSGPIVPTVSTINNSVYDYNLNPPMSAKELKAAYKLYQLDSGLDSMGKFGAELGLGYNAATRLKDMMRGKKTVSPAVEKAVTAWLQNSNENIK